MLKTFSIIALVLASMHFVKADPENGSYDEYMRGALIVYSNEIVPSLDNSVEFLEHLNDKWKSAKCSSSCYQTGYLEAKTFIAKREDHGSKIR
ncbi:lysis inhibition [Aeromonas phage AS-gz]|uniref:Lysis inhibition regulator membrane protein n=1 Tax=Aeromonas phage AS-gz TaxID=2026082 RepID=A0A223LEM3_9CAUD|nr:lysis inhibition [Aeromonas phage AS-gz]ASU00727.1 lysis inhibition regulator membrane protein [Aeromonas phage AS-gz]